jgi:hypothetical protein
MVVITRRRKVGTICGHEIYSIGKSEMIAVPSVIVWPNVAYSRDENRSFVFSTCKYYVLPTLIPFMVPSNIETARFASLRTFRGFIIHLSINPFFAFMTSSFFCYLRLSCNFFC